MGDNVISLGSRRSYHQEQAEMAAAVQIETEQIEKQLNEAQNSHKETLLKMLTDTIKLVEADQLEGMLVIGRHKTSKLFYTDVVLDDRIIPPHDLFSYVGCLETLKMELADSASMAPCIRSDGSTLDPFDPLTIDVIEGNLDD